MKHRALLEALCAAPLPEAPSTTASVTRAARDSQEGTSRSERDRAIEHAAWMARLLAGPAPERPRPVVIDFDGGPRGGTTPRRTLNWEVAEQIREGALENEAMLLTEAEDAFLRSLRRKRSRN